MFMDFGGVITNFLEHIALVHGYTISRILESGTRLLEPGALETCICIHILWCVCVCCFHDIL